MAFRILRIKTLTLLICAGLVAGTVYFINYSNTAQAAAVTSAKSGNWSDPAVWSTGSVPVAGDVVTIAPTHTVTYNILSNAVLSDVNISGTLKFSRTTDTRLKTAGNVMVNMGGFLDMGTPQDVIPQNVKTEVIWVLPQGYIFTGGPAFVAEDTGLWAMHGSRWEAHGAPIVRAWSKLVQNAPAGSTSVVLEGDVSDWYAGGY